MNGSIFYTILYLSLGLTRAAKPFEVIFHKTGNWTSTAIAEYQGHIPAMAEFTACHWEKMQYFAISSNTIWSYCTVRSTEDQTLRCIQLYSKGLPSTAYRSISYNLWISGMSNNQTIKIEIGLDRYRHRAWNHVCWYFSRRYKTNKLYYNGNLVGKKEVHSLPLIEASVGSHDHFFILGQEPDKIRGGFEEEQAFFGSISGLNIWSTFMSSTMIENMARCRNYETGNVLAWEKEKFVFKDVIVRSVNQTDSFCKSKKRFVIFPQRYLLGSASDVCSTHGGTMVAPASNSENNLVRSILSKHSNTCSNNFLSERKVGIGVWLGLTKIGSTWFQSNDSITFSELTYYNWIKGKSNFRSHEAKCAYMLGDGSWISILKEECAWMQLCVICVISKTPVLTMKGLCKTGAFVHWNYYASINGSNQINKYDSYKRGDPLSLVKNHWSMQTENDLITLQGTNHYPVGKNEWMWRESGCSNENELTKRNLTFSVCEFGKQFTCDFGNCISIEHRCDGTQDCNDGSDEKNCIFIVRPFSYQKLQPPKNKKDRDKANADIVVNVDIVVEHIHLIDTANMMLGATLRIKMRWKDSRLTFKHLHQNQKKRVNPNLLKDIWSPLDHLVFDNAVIGNKYAEKEKKFSIVANSEPLPLDVYLNREENMFDGKTTEMEILQRWKDTYTCTFQFINYPFEMHTCHFFMSIESPDDTSLEIITDSIKYNGSRTVNQFEITNGFNRNVSLADRQKGNMCFTIHLKRMGGNGYKAIFLPTLILSMLAYLTMFLAVDDFTNRNRISVTVLLCLTTLFGTLSIKQDFPKTTEFKYVDLWFLWYLANTFLVICHHVMIDKLSRNSFSRSPKTKPSSGQMKKEDRFPIIINYIVATFFFAVNMSFNIIYFSIAT